MNPTYRAPTPRCPGWARFFISALLTAAIAGGAEARDIIIFSASSTTDAVAKIGTDYEAVHDAKIVASFAGTSALARQIENGAPADIFIAANTDWMDYVEDRGLIEPGTRVDLTRNALVFVAPIATAHPFAVSVGLDLAGRLGDGRLAIGDPDHVPVGIYTKAALQSLGLWSAIAPRTARMNNVRATLAMAERGEVPLAVVYKTDARISRRTRIVAELPATSHPPIVYPIAIVAGRDTSDVRRFYDYLLSTDAAAVFADFGFTAD